MTKFSEEHAFMFDEVFDSECDNEIVYRKTAQPLVEYIFTGGKATCFAYGQTGLIFFLTNRQRKNLYNA
jgi:dihydrodipicolinate synthase/N-acetylneuraminate lyase